MTFDEARTLLSGEGWLQPDGDIFDAAQYIDCKGGFCTLDGQFDLDQLEAVVVYLRNREA
jgi:hypothetical protein